MSNGEIFYRGMIFGLGLYVAIIATLILWKL